MSKYSNLDPAISALLSRYSAEIIDYRRVLELPPRETLSEMRAVARTVKGTEFFQIPFEEMKLFVIKIPEIALKALAKENEFYSKQLSKDGLELLDELVKSKQFEERMRASNPAIKEAWEKYMTLLMLSADKATIGPFDIS
ncbi:MAG: hypothetical protein N2235_05195 [Fischerella sp.]|nr:hypothetical protein [Fischerella sp.]